MLILRKTVWWWSVVDIEEESEEIIGTIESGEFTMLTNKPLMKTELMQIIKFMEELENEQS